MRNDTIDFIFSNSEAGDVRLDPQAIAELARTLESMLATVLSSLGPQKEATNIKAYLVAIHPGSAVVSFFIDHLPALANEIKSSPLGSLNNAFDIAEHLAGISVAIAVHLRLAKPERADAVIPSEPALANVISQDLINNLQVRRVIEAMVEQAMRAGSEHVALRAPGQPVVILSREGSTDIKLIGSAAASRPASGEFDGMVRVGSDELILTWSTAAIEQERSLYNGTVLVGETHVPVVVEWRSRRPVPRPEGSDDFSDYVRVKGNFFSTRSLFDNSQGSRNSVYHDGRKAIPISFRIAASMLRVASQTFEE